MTGANTFAGGVTINGGTLQIGSNSALSYNQITNTGLRQNVNFGAAFGTLALNGFNTTIQDFTSVAGATAAVAQNGAAGNAVLTVTPTGTDNYFGTLQDGSGGGTLGLTKNGPNILNLRNAGDTYSGETVVNGGILTFLVAGAQGNTSDIALNAGGTISVQQSASVGVGPVIPLATLAGLMKAGSAGTLAFGFNNPDTETVTLPGPVFFGAGSGNFSTFNGTVNAVNGNYRFGGGGVGQLTINSSGAGAPSAAPTA